MMTFGLSFNDVLMQNAGWGARVAFDKAGIFNQLYAVGSYSYNLTVSDEHHILFGLSAGLHHNSVNLTEYYNDPNYNIDPALVQEDVASKVKFLSDASLVYLYKGLEAGLVLSNITFGDATYKNAKDLKYNPISVFQFHASYLFNVSEMWDLVPFVLIRGGKTLKASLKSHPRSFGIRGYGEVLSTVIGTLGLGLGANIDRGLQIGYNFNLPQMSRWESINHEVTIGFNFFEYLKKKD